MHGIGEVQRREEGSVRGAGLSGEGVSAEGGVESERLVPGVRQGARLLREAADEGAAGASADA